MITCSRDWLIALAADEGRGWIVQRYLRSRVLALGPVGLRKGSRTIYFLRLFLEFTRDENCRINNLAKNGVACQFLP